MSFQSKSNNDLSNSNNIQRVTCKAYLNFLERETVDLEFNAHGLIGQGTFGKIHLVRNLEIDGNQHPAGA